MWEHRSISDEYLRTNRRIQPMETYVELMGMVERGVAAPQSHAFDDEDFLQYIPRSGPWAPQMNTDMTTEDPRRRYIGKGVPKFLNTNIILGSSWIESDRFRFERDLNTMSDWVKQKTILQANMWTPAQVVTTQTLVFCSTGDEDRMGSALSVRADPTDFEIPGDDHMFLGVGPDGFPEWEPLVWGLGHRGVVPGSDPQERVYYPSLMHRNVTYNNRLGWIRYSPAGFGKDANGYLMTKPYDWIWQAVNGNRDTPSAFNLLVNMPDRRDSFGEDGITDIFLTSGKTSLYTMMGMMNSATVRQMFGGGSDLVPLEMHIVEPGLDEWVQRASDEDRYGRLFEYTATLGYLLTDPNIGTLGEGAGRRRLLVYPQDQANLLTSVNASQVADHALKGNYQATVFTKLDQADFQNRVSRRMSQYADLITPSAKARGQRWVSQANWGGEDGVQQGATVHSLLAVRGYEVLQMEEYRATFNEVSAAPQRLMNRLIQSVATNALKTVYPLNIVTDQGGGGAPYQKLFSPMSSDEPLVYYTDIRFLVPTTIDDLRSQTGQKGADRAKLRDAFTELTGADPVTGLQVLDLCLPFLAEMGPGSWQQGTGVKPNEVIVEVTCAVNPNAVWKSLLEPTLNDTFQLPKGKKGTAANIWGDVLIQNDQLQEKMKKDGIEPWLRMLKMIYHYSNNLSKKRNGL